MPTAGTASAAAGVISLVLLTASVVLGIVVSQRRQVPGLPRYQILLAHQYLSLLCVAFLAIHIVAAVAMPFAGVRLISSVIPFASPRDPFWLGLGAISFDLVVALTVTSQLRRRIGRRTWRAVHWLAYGCWPAGLAHSTGTGTGMHAGRLLALAVACTLAVLAATGWRLATGLLGRRAIPSPSGAGQAD